MVMNGGEGWKFGVDIHLSNDFLRLPGLLGEEREKAQAPIVEEPATAMAWVRRERKGEEEEECRKKGIGAVVH